MEASEQLGTNKVLSDKTPKELMVEKLLTTDELEHRQPAGAQIQLVSPRTITGPTNHLNVLKGAIDW